jgi:hypothetical protein
MLVGKPDAEHSEAEQILVDGLTRGQDRKALLRQTVRRFILYHFKWIDLGDGTWRTLRYIKKITA